MLCPFNEYILYIYRSRGADGVRTSPSPVGETPNSHVFPVMYGVGKHQLQWPQSTKFTNYAEKRTNGAEKRTNGAEKRTNGAEKRTNGAEKRTNGAEKRLWGHRNQHSLAVSYIENCNFETIFKGP